MLAIYTTHYKNDKLSIFLNNNWVIDIKEHSGITQRKLMLFFAQKQYFFTKKLAEELSALSRCKLISKKNRIFFVMFKYQSIYIYYIYWRCGPILKLPREIIKKLQLLSGIKLNPHRWESVTIPLARPLLKRE